MQVNELKAQKELEQSNRELERDLEKVRQFPIFCHIFFRVLLHVPASSSATFRRR